MVNMYSMGMMTGMPGMNGMGGGFGNSGVNVHQQLKQKYGVGYEDFGTVPYAQPYPMAIVPRRPETPLQKNLFYDFLKKCFT